MCYINLHFTYLLTERIAPKICQGQLDPENVLKMLQILSKSVHFRWSYTQTREHRQKCLQYSAEA